jgi:hypothetical protein
VSDKCGFRPIKSFIGPASCRLCEEREHTAGSRVNNCRITGQRIHRVGHRRLDCPLTGENHEE